MPRFAANLTMMFNEVPFLDRFEAARRAGFDAVEYLFPYDHPVGAIVERLQRYDLKQVLFNAPPGDWASGERGIAALAERRDEFRQSIALALEYGVATGVPNIHVMAGKIPPDDVLARQTYRDNLRFAADEAASRNITILIEPLNTRDNPGYHLASFDDAADLIAALDHPGIKLQFDIYHRQILHGDVISALRLFKDILGHVQVASVPDRHEPGTGELNDAVIFNELDALGYRGFVGCEYRPAAGTVEGLVWIEALATPPAR